MASDPRASLLVVTRGNGSLKLEGFLKHDHFAYKPAHSHINPKKHFGIQIFKTLKEKENQNKVICILHSCMHIK